MKTNFFTQSMRMLLIVIIACHLFIPSHLVAAKSLATFTDCASQSQIPEMECNTLVIIYNNMGGATWYDHTDWLQTDTPCSWYGVTCSGGTNVTGLSMIQNNMSGSFPPELANLTQLTTLELFKNSLTGSIPVELSNLTNLTVLNLRSNGLNGSIPPELGNLTNLTELDLQSNHLNGPIPSELTNLTHLTTLVLSSNPFGGAIPTWLGSMTSLTILSLESNDFSGSIPAELTNLTNLTILSLGGNTLSGSIPVGLGNLTNLKYLLLYQNNLSGSIPIELGNLTQLQYLQLHNNSLTGSIPTTLGNLTQLNSLTLYNNALTGSIPTELGNLINLISLDLNNNRLTGEFPTSITNMTNLIFLYFDCELTSTNSDVITFINALKPDWQHHTCPALVAPSEGAILDNGRLDRLDDIVWDFNWSDVPGATSYELYVSHNGTATPIIDKLDIVNSAYHYVGLNSYITEANRYNWQWKSRAYLNGQWGDWSRIQTFNVEPLNTDPFQVITKNGGVNIYTSTFRIPKYWKAINFSGTDGKNTKIKQEGAASVQINGVAGKIKTLSQTIFVNGPTGDRFIFSYRVKGSAIPTVGICKGQVLFYKAGVLKGSRTLLCPKATATFAFTKMTLQSTAPVAYDKIVITFTYSKASGTVWFDNVSLIR